MKTIIIDGVKYDLTPKALFKKGDWIVYCSEDVDLITGIEDEGYITNKGGYIPFICEEEMRLWTIQDAKDGDVLVCEGKISKNEYGQEIGIVKKYVGRVGGCNNCFETYCFIDWDGNFIVSKAMGSSNIHPSTKEQRDLLFQKMKEAGYEFDVERKELNKIEQKPTWSEEDEEHVNSLLKRLKGLCRGKFATTRFAVSEDEEWLKSLKERMKGE